MNRKLLLFCLLLLAILAVRFLFFYSGREMYSDKQRITFHTTLLSEPKLISNKQSLSANLPNGERVYVTTDVSSSFNYGDNLNISGTLNKQLLTDGRSIWTMIFPEIRIESNRLIVLNVFRQKIISLFHTTLPQPYSSLLLGIVFGIKEDMDKNFLDQLRSVGVLHVIAASGMNVVMVGGFLSSIFSLFFKRQKALIFSIFGIFLYALISGFEPSIVRASIMGSLVFMSQILGRQSSASYGLFLTGFFMLFVSPTLFTDVGFQLSFAATCGLLYLRPIFEKENFKNIIERSIIGEDVVTTVAAQAATLPILLVNFGSYSIWSILVNALILWTIPPLMILGGLGAILGFVSGSLGVIFIYLCFPLLLYFEKIVSIFGQGGLIDVAVFPWQMIVGYYIILFAFVISLRRK